jgi:hypothetical protein
MSVLDRLPPLATAGVGSLPFTDPTLAVRHACRAYDLPFCPQLPALDGDMVGEWVGAAATTPCGWSADRDRERPAAWDAFVARVSRNPPGHGLVKLQVTGPVTLAVALERAAGRGGQGRAATALARELDGWLATNVRGQVARLAAAGLDALVVVDEPGLAHAVAGLGREETGADVGVWDALRSSGAAWGLHVCCAVPWSVLRAAEPDWISFDATASPVGGRGALVLGELVRRGGRIAWGALDPVAPDGRARRGDPRALDRHARVRHGPGDGGPRAARGVRARGGCGGRRRHVPGVAAGGPWGGCRPGDRRGRVGRGVGGRSREVVPVREGRPRGGRPLGRLRWRRYARRSAYRTEGSRFRLAFASRAGSSTSTSSAPASIPSIAARTTSAAATVGPS